LKDTATPVQAAGLSFVVNIILSLVLMRWFSTVGLALAGNLAVLAQAWYLQVKLARKQQGLGFAPLWGSLGKITSASALMGLLVWGGLRLATLLPLAPKMHDLVVILVLIPVAVAFYGTLLWLMKIEGRDELGLILNKVAARVSAK
jgi:putative peptidoglycan lipid II flippase